ncbi:MAG TPA: DUF3800 domain-containing protein [Clostridiaceae bacterium]|nr:DUF3800 domain-containing protein [Clostridiaceae bacterium]
MYIYYIDDSGDQNVNIHIFTAIGVPSHYWNEVFNTLKRFRKYLKDEYGIRLAKELHATEFLAGRGKLGNRIVSKWERAEIFKKCLRTLAWFECYGVECINVALPSYDDAVDRIINRINRSLLDKQEEGIVIFDKGDETRIKRAIRKMRVFNPIPSMFGAWEDLHKTKNITVDKIIADVFFRDSKDDYFIQCADFVAFALLRKDYPTEKIKKYDLDTAFEILDPILNKKAHYADPYGVVRR